MVFGHRPSRMLHSTNEIRFGYGPRFFQRQRVGVLCRTVDDRAAAASYVGTGSDCLMALILRPLMRLKTEYLFDGRSVEKSRVASLNLFR